MENQMPVRRQKKKQKPKFSEILAGLFIAGQKRKRRPIGFSAWFFIITFIYIEVVFHIKEFRNISCFFPVLFAIPAGFFAGFFCDLFPEKIARWVRYILSGFYMLYVCVQIVYFHSFQSFLSLSMAGMGDDVFTNFFKTIVLAVWESMIPIILTFLPLGWLHFYQKRILRKRSFCIKRALVSFLSGLLAIMLVVLMLPLGGTSEHSAYANFHNNWVLDLSMEKLGIITTTGIDIKNLVAGDVLEETLDEPDVPVAVTLPEENDEPDVTTPEEPVIEYNVIEGLDFGKMAESESNKNIKKILQYLDTLEPTKKNEYTGMFAGYNLILITAESFSPEGIDENLTPTLYKLANSGFNFTNYWATFPSNTTHGEYANMTGLMPDISKPKKNGSFVASIGNTMNMNIANFFNAQGVKSLAYHDHTATYYKRNQTHPNLGYEFKGRKQIGGLSGWPESDLIMMQNTVEEYINSDWFHAYYMTVSGHHNYRFGYNAIADKNKEYVKNLDASEAEKAYLATHIELDKALEYLIQRLKEAGKLEKTVIVLATDHYPYGLTDSQYKKIVGHSIQYGGMERHKSDLFIWNSAMETVTVDKPCSAVDVLPTLLNLFGFTYDSRLYSGTDIFSDAPGIAMTANQSFITDKIIYNSRYEKVYKLDESWEMPEGYLDSYIQVVKNRFSVAANFLKYDFYAKLPQDVIATAQKQQFQPKQ